MVSAVKSVNGSEKASNITAIGVWAGVTGKKEASALDSAIASLRGKFNAAKKSGWDDSANAWGAAHYAIPLISLLTIRAGAGDREEAKGLITQIQNTKDLVWNSYYKGTAKIYLANIYFNEINDGVMDESRADEVMTLCAEGRKIVKNPQAAKDVQVEDDTDMAITTIKKKGTKTARSLDEIDYYAIHLSELIELQARFIRKGYVIDKNTNKVTSELDSDADLIKGYEDVKTGIIADKPKVKGERADVTLLGLDMLIQMADAQIAALAKDNRLAEDETQATADLAEVNTEIDRAKRVVSATGMEQVQNGIIEKGYTDYYRNKGLALPKESFDYYSAKITLADLLVKRAIMTGNANGTDLSDAIALYKECVGKIFDTGTFKSYISIWANLGLINAAIAFDKLQGLELGSYDPKTGKFTTMTFSGKNAAISTAIKYLSDVRAKSPALIPAGKFMYCQLMLAEANLRLMRMDGTDTKTAKGLLDSVIGYALKFRNLESRYDMIARAMLIKARAIVWDPTSNRGTAETPEIALTLLGEEVEPVDAKGRSVKLLADYTALECLAAASNAAARLFELSKKKMDLAFYSDINSLGGMLYSQQGDIYYAMYMKDKELSDKPDQANYNAYTKWSGKATTYYADAVAACQKPRNKSVYCREVMTNLILIDLNVMDAYAIDITPTDLATANKYYKQFTDIAADVAKPKPPIDKAIEVKDGDQKKYVDARKAVKRIDVLSRAVFFVNNQMSGTYNTATKKVKIDALYADIIATLTTDGAIIEAQLTEGEKKPMYSNLVSVAMIALSFTEIESERTALIAKIKDYCFKALGVADVAALAARFNADTQLIMPYGIGDALLAVGLNTNDVDLIRAADEYCFSRLIALNAIPAEDKKAKGKKPAAQKPEMAASLKRKKDILARCYANRANIINWKADLLNPQLMRDPEKLTAADIAEYNKAIELYNLAIEYGLGDRDLSVRVNLEEARFKVKAGVKAITDAQIVAKVESLTDISVKLDAIIALADANGDPLADKPMLRTPHSTFVKNKVAIMKAKMWKAVIIVSCGDLAKINTPAAKAAIKANTYINADTPGLDIDSNPELYDLKTLKGIQAVQEELFKRAIDLYDGLATAVTNMGIAYGITERGMGDVGVNTVSLSTNYAISLSILSVIANDGGKETDAKSRLESLLRDTSKMTPLQAAEARKAIGSLLAWRGLGRQDYYKAAVEYLKAVSDYYIKLRKDAVEFKRVPLAVSNVLADALEMRMYDPATLKDNKTTKVIQSWDEPTLKELNELIDNIIKYGDPAEDAWSNATLKKAAMILLLAQTDLGKMSGCVDLTEKVLTNKAMPTPIAAPKALPVNKAAGNMYEARAMAADAKIKYYINAIVNSTDPAVKNNRFFITALSALGEIEARLISSIGELTAGSGEVKNNQAFYLPIFQATVDNLSSIYNFLSKLDKDPNGRFFNKLNEKVDPNGPMGKIIKWINILGEGAVKTWNVNLK